MTDARTPPSGGPRGDEHWIELGQFAFGVVSGGKLAAVLYWTQAGVGTIGDAERDPAVYDEGWFLVLSSSPEKHVLVTSDKDVGVALEGAEGVLVGDHDEEG